MSIFHVREAKQEDALGMAKVRVDTWRAAYKGIVPDDFLDSLSSEEIAERWKRTFWEDRNPKIATLVAENSQGEMIGIAMCGPETSGDFNYRGEVYLLYVLPQYQNQGVGRALVGACVQYLMQRLNLHTMLIWVLAENPYRKFYESIGGKAVREKTQEIGGKLLPEVGYGWEEISTLHP